MSDGLQVEYEAGAREQALVAAVRLAVGAFSTAPHLDALAPTAGTESRERPIVSVVPRPWT